MNIVLDGAVDDKMKQDIGMVVRRRVCLFFFFFFNFRPRYGRKLNLFPLVFISLSIVTITALEPIVDT